MNFKVGDKVVVISGKSKGTEGKIIKTFRNDNKVIVEGANMITKHVKPNANNENGGIIKVEAPIDASNVMIIDPKTKKRTRIAKKIDEKGNKQRISVKSKEILK
jgi:large subunit ribosomal protein L24